MLRNQEERDLDREFARIETWEEFLSRWQSIDTEEEAEGLLFKGVTIPMPFEKESGEIRRRVAFYLKWSEHKNRNIAWATEQIIIKHWLKRVHPNINYGSTHALLLEFLQNQRMSLLKPPYPRFIAEYLLKVYQVSRFGDHPGYKSSKLYEEYRILLESVVYAMLVWGLGYKLASDGFKEAIPIIDGFLQEKKYDAGNALMKISGYGDPLPDLSFPNAQEEIKERAALALLKLRYWVGEGVNEKFNKTKELEKIKERLWKK